jgi:enoyl-CoA hydratase/carnithine racemase
MTEVLKIERSGAVEIASLNRPHALNAMNRDLIAALNDYFEGLHDRTDVRVVLLRAEGKAFCAGLDIKEGNLGDALSTREMLDLQKRIARIYKLMRSCPQPIIALVQGAACGGGFSLALAADVRYAAPNARMNAAYIRIGLSACDMGCSYFLPRLVGGSLASELMLTGRFIGAERALKAGLVSDVVPEEQLISTGLALADEMLLNTPMGLRLTKEGLNSNIDAPSLAAAMDLEDRQQVLLSTTDDHREALAAFLQKRPPRYADR